MVLLITPKLDSATHVYALVATKFFSIAIARPLGIPPERDVSSLFCELLHRSLSDCAKDTTRLLQNKINKSCTVNWRKVNCYQQLNWK